MFHERLCSGVLRKITPQTDQCHFGWLICMLYGRVLSRQILVDAAGGADNKVAQHMAKAQTAALSLLEHPKLRKV